MSSTFITRLLIAVVLIGVLIFGIIRFRDFLPSNRGRAADTTVKIMTFNVLDDHCSPYNNEADINAIISLIKNNGIRLAALQEVLKRDDSCVGIDMPQLYHDKLDGTGYSVYDRHYLGSNDYKLYRLFIHQGGVVPLIRTPDSDIVPNTDKLQGAESIVLDTELGKIRFINIHPESGQEALNMAPTLVQFINSFKNNPDPAISSIPIIVMGDFNLRYDLNDARPVLNAIEAAGFYRACNPSQFTEGQCDSTTWGDYAVDHIMIDNRATFRVKNAYVEKSLTFSTHKPVIVELEPGIKSTPPSSAFPSSVDTFWDGAKLSTTNKYLWSNGGPTTGWESYGGNRVYICNEKSCWTIERRTDGVTQWANNGVPFEMDQNSAYSGLLSPPNVPNLKPWSKYDPQTNTVNGLAGKVGPTSAWTWIVQYNGQTVNETTICNGNYCWRYVRNPDGTGLWRDNGAPMHLPTANAVWSDPRVASLWAGNGITSAWTDPINSRVTLCNGTDCRSINYKNWVWRVFNETTGSTVLNMGPYSSAWTSPVTSIITLCTGSTTCKQYNLVTNTWRTDTYSIAGSGVAPTNTPIPPSPTRTNTPIPPTPTRTPTRTPTPHVACTDSDGGNTPGISGYIVVGGTQIITDDCNFSTSVLTERYCQSTSSTGYANATYTCQYGCGHNICLPPPPTRTPTPSNLGAFNLISPISSTSSPIVVDSSTITLKWAASPGASSYEYQLKPEGFSGYIPVATVTTSACTVSTCEITLTGVKSARYVWTVYAKNSVSTRQADNYGYGQFKVPLAKIDPRLNGQVLYGSSHTFKWRAVSNYYDSMYFFIYSSTDITNPIYFKQFTKTSPEFLNGTHTLTLNSTTNAKFTTGGTYTWQLTASSGAGYRVPNDGYVNPQAFSLVAILPTNTPVPPLATNTPIPPTCVPIPAPTNLLPITNTVMAAGNRRISWTGVSGASAYSLRIDDLSNPWDGGCVVNAGDVCLDVTGTNYTYNFVAGHRYSVWVHSRSACNGSYSPAKGVTYSATDDLNNDGIINVNDLKAIVRSWPKTAITVIDQIIGTTKDGKINALDFVQFLKFIR